MRVLKNWIAVEGLNASGKTSFLDFLKKKTAKTEPNFLFFRDTFTEKRFKGFKTEGQKDHIYMRDIGLRLDLNDAIEAGKTVFSDRSFISTFVYGDYKAGTFLNSLAEINKGCLPELVVYKEIDFERFQKRMHRQQLHEGKFLDKEEKSMVNSRFEFNRRRDKLNEAIRDLKNFNRIRCIISDADEPHEALFNRLGSFLNQ